MTTYRDVAEADAFLRRRLVAAFLSGERTRSGTDGPRPGRCLAGGLVLAMLLAAVVAASIVATGHPAVSWIRGGVRLFW
jgi:hypothetical protein